MADQVLRGRAMKQFRLNIAGLMGLILLAGAGFAALRGGSALWASIIFSLAATLLAIAPLGIYAGRGAARLGWMGFASFGGLYFAVTFGPIPNGNGVSAPPFPTMLAYEPLAVSLTPPLGPETEIRNSAPLPDPIVPRQVVRLSGSGAGAASPVSPSEEFKYDVYSSGGYKMELPATGVPGVTVHVPRIVDFLNFRRILHSLGVIAFGMIGAGVGLVFASRDGRESAPVRVG